MLPSDLPAAIDAALAYLDRHPDHLTCDQLDAFAALADRVYLLAARAGLLASLPQVPELRSELEATTPELHRRQFETKLNLPGVWDGPPYPETEGDLLIPPRWDDPPAPPPPPALFFYVTGKRWRHDLDTLRTLAAQAPAPTPALPPMDLGDYPGLDPTIIQNGGA